MYILSKWLQTSLLTTILAIAALEPYHFAPNVLQTPKIIAVKIVEWIITWKKYIVKRTKSVAGFSPSYQFQVRQKSIT